jgi:hypothetical protein
MNSWGHPPRRLAAAVVGAEACSGAAGEACFAQFETDGAGLQHVPASRDGKQRRQAAALRIRDAGGRLSLMGDALTSICVGYPLGRAIKVVL